MSHTLNPGKSPKCECPHFSPGHTLAVHPAPDVCYCPVYGSEGHLLSRHDRYAVDRFGYLTKMSKLTAGMQGLLPRRHLESKCPDCGSQKLTLMLTVNGTTQEQIASVTCESCGRTASAPVLEIDQEKKEVTVDGSPKKELPDARKK